MERIDETAQPAAAPLSPICREIRSKKTFMLDTIPMSAGDVYDASGHCWCRLTMQPAGPDGEFVDPRECVPGRSCYRSHFEAE